MKQTVIRKFSMSSKSYFKRKSTHGDVFRALPKVPTTQFLESRELTRDILFSGYRPVTYPVRENPLFSGRVRGGEALIGEQVGRESSVEDEIEKPEFTVMSGPRGCGGIKSGGVNGTWRYGPRVPNKLVPYDLWSTTTMGMEYFPEWINVPRHVVRKLRPFDREAGIFKKRHT
ncbi:hypothetical protein HG537_0C05340 [Torulaspora globosa]|uniref:Uncharacterized protein n=1 Tax=Torulaspora globosa TaxID=48254 RepID=A0A7H9HRX7_9SACH|nr:hypothetical protein HG537_0C05340 [Torulaspora sp. CBS 2947]